MKIFFFLSFFMSVSIWANSDVEQLLTLVNEREDAMQTKNLPLAMKNFPKTLCGSTLRDTTSKVLIA